MENKLRAERAPAESGLYKKARGRARSWGMLSNNLG